MRDDGALEFQTREVREDAMNSVSHVLVSTESAAGCLVNIITHQFKSKNPIVWLLNSSSRQAVIGVPQIRHCSYKFYVRVTVHRYNS